MRSEGSGSSALSGSGAAPLVRCHACDLLQQVPPLLGAAAARCRRCGVVVAASKPEGFHRAFALYAAALILLGLANAFPFLTLKAQGNTQPSHLLSGAIDLIRAGMPEVGVAILLFVFGFPLFKVVIGLLVVGPLTFGRRLPGAPALYRIFAHLHPWAMTEIFLLGVLVSYTKLIGLATVEIGSSLVAFVGFILAMIAADSAIEPRDVWERLGRSPCLAFPPRSQRRRLVGCHICALVCRLPKATPKGAGLSCPRCDAALHRRRPDSLPRTAALLLTAAILYVPANLYPVMTFSSFGSGEPSTILGGVKELIAANMWPLALIVFVASVLVPVLKLISMAYLLISVRRRSRWRTRDRTLLFRINEAVGRWSMVDVFVVSILVALVQFGSLVTILPGPGIIAFGGVVVVTMLAAISFDPRLIWDAAGANDDES